MYNKNNNKKTKTNLIPKICFPSYSPKQSWIRPRFNPHCTRWKQPWASLTWNTDRACKFFLTSNPPPLLIHSKLENSFLHFYFKPFNGFPPWSLVKCKIHTLHSKPPDVSLHCISSTSFEASLLLSLSHTYWIRIIFCPYGPLICSFLLQNCPSLCLLSLYSNFHSWPKLNFVPESLTCPSQPSQSFPRRYHGTICSHHTINVYLHLFFPPILFVFLGKL